jgi:hypothetical protein
MGTCRLYLFSLTCSTVSIACLNSSILASVEDAEPVGRCSLSR